MDVSYPVSDEAEEARAAVRDYAAMKPAFIKIWVDDRGGTEEDAHARRSIERSRTRRTSSISPVGVHNVTLANAKELMRAGVEGWLHVPVPAAARSRTTSWSRIVKDRIARNDRPNIWMTPSLDHGVDGYAGRRAARMARRPVAAAPCIPLVTSSSTGATR